MRNKNKEKKPTARMLLGRRGEDVACVYLEGMGHQIIERNHRSGHLEIDIISLDGNGVHFVEVKSRVAPVAAAPEENVTSLKQKKIANAALKYLHGSKDPLIAGGAEVNFDIIAVTFDGGETKVEWFPNAFFPMYL
ncbi:MAG: YraN family protein [Bacteroidales bacterium]|jgi:putative endonuclease|nr:YraN family protein [Bacteroidales bacterium]MBO6248102.1 YraN family protein [Bacteroidales bacterium]